MKRLLDKIVLLMSFCLLVSCDREVTETFPVLSGPYLGQKPPGMTPEIFAPGIINTDDKNHSSVAASPDGNEMYWSMFSHIDGIRQERIWYMKQEGGKWTKPEVAPFSGEYRDGQPSLSPDGSRLFFSSLRPIDQNDGSGDANIWYIGKTDTGWSDPVCLDNVVNSEYQEWFPTVANNGNLYYGFYRKDSPTSWDIYCSEFIDGTYTLPEKMSGVVNGEFYEGTPYIDPDEEYIIFFSERPKGRFEEGKLYISFKKADGTWTPAESLGEEINSTASRFPNMSPDGNYFFFTRLKGDMEHIYWVDAKIIEELKPDHLK
ncbi:MAG: hypothetical protein GY863_08695 [bacterium]|nr:hypothetical protein [bacterium]